MTETIQDEAVLVERDEHGVTLLAIPIGGGWDVYEGQAARDKYEAITKGE